MLLVVALGAAQYTEAQVSAPSRLSLGPTSLIIMGGTRRGQPVSLWPSVLMFGYVAFYLGLGKLLLGWIRSGGGHGGHGSWPCLFQAMLLVLVGCSAPRIIELALSGFDRFGYNLLYAFDPFKTLDEVLTEQRGRAKSTFVAIAHQWSMAGCVVSSRIC